MPLRLCAVAGVPQLLDEALQWLLPHLQHNPQWSTCLYLASDCVVDQLPQSSWYGACRGLAEQHLQSHLGSDMEAIMQCPSKSNKLLSLPYPLLLRLLSSHETKVACESTVVAVIT